MAALSMASMPAVARSRTPEVASMSTVASTPSTVEALSRPSPHDLFSTGAGVPPRPQQLDCINRVCDALKTDCDLDTPSNYLIQHATGSGKSLTIAALAHQIASIVDSRGNRFRRVIVVADRKALEEQLGEVVQGYFESHGDGELLDRAESCAHLRQLLEPSHDTSSCQVVVTTFQKALSKGEEAKHDFIKHEKVESWLVDDRGEAIEDGGGEGSCSAPRIAILADEAHRSHGHGTTAALHALLCGGAGQPRHIAYVSFTATPSDLAMRLFGVTNHLSGRREPFHCFSLREALAAGLCVDTLSCYTTARPSVNVADEHGKTRSLDDVLSAPAKRGASQRAVARAAAARAALVDAKADGALSFACKAMEAAESAGMDDPKVLMVVRSRQHCADYRQALLKLQAARSSPEESVASRLSILVAFSGTLDGDGGEGESSVSERSLNGGDVLSLFRRRGPALLIVCAKFETGFDEPRICALVIDRTLRGAHAVQVLGRANRACESKPPVRVLDYANSAADIAAAFRSFLGATSRSLLEHERRAHLGLELAHISLRLLEMIADRSVRAAAAAAIADDEADSLTADLEEYIRGCEALGEEAVGLPYGFATRLLSEVRAARRTASGGAQLKADDDMAGGLSMRIGALATTFSGRIPVDNDSSAPTRMLTRPLTHASDLSLTGDEGAAMTLSAAASAAAALNERAVQSLISGLRGAQRGGSSAQQPLSEEELRKANDDFRALLSGRLSATEGQALLVAALQRPAPAVKLLRTVKAGTTLKSLAKGHGHASITALASALLEKWKAAAEAEERRAARGERAEVAIVAEDPMRQTAAVHLAEALKATSGGTASDGALAASIEAALFSANGKETGKAYRSRARLLCSSLRSSKGDGLRKRLRSGELKAEGLCLMDERELSEALLTEEERRLREEKKEKERKAIESIRIENAGEQSDEYTCQNCKSRRCALFHTNSMGAVHLTSVPDMIVECLDCGERFTIG